MEVLAGNCRVYTPGMSPVPLVTSAEQKRGRHKEGEIHITLIAENGRKTGMTEYRQLSVKIMRCQKFFAFTHRE